MTVGPAVLATGTQRTATHMTVSRGRTGNGSTLRYYASSLRLKRDSVPVLCFALAAVFETPPSARSLAAACRLQWSINWRRNSSSSSCLLDCYTASLSLHGHGLHLHCLSVSLTSPCLCLPLLLCLLTSWCGDFFSNRAHIFFSFITCYITRDCRSVHQVSLILADTVLCYFLLY